MKVEAVDLFCGVGGLTAGLKKAGIDVKAGYDIEPSCRFGYEFNNHAVFMQKDIAEVTSDEIKSYYSAGAIRVLAGCAPCQPFSSYRSRKGHDATADKKYPLLYHFSRLIEQVQPEIVIMENVPKVSRYPVYLDFVANLTKMGYQIDDGVVDCTRYGIPQTRKRHVLIACRLGQIALIPSTHETPITVQQAVAHLPPIKAGERHPNDRLHVSATLTDINLKRIQASLPGGSWRDWSDDLIADCHKKDTGKSYSGVYGRMAWHQPSPTMTTQCYGFGNGRFGHPEQDRAISMREAAIFQTFPDNYQFFDKEIGIKSLGRLIGNAVPVRLGEVIGISCFEGLKKLRIN